MKPGFDHKRVEALLELVGCARLTRIVDVGASPIITPPYKPLLDMGGCEVWGFEPQADAYTDLMRDAGEHEHYVPDAVGDGSMGHLKVCHGSGYTSLLEPSRKAMGYLGYLRRAMKVVETVELQTKRLDDVDDIPEFDLLKIDIQGGETDVFLNGMGKLKSAVAVITEVAAIPLYEDQPLLDEQMRILRDVGYHLHKFQTFKKVKLRTKHTGDLKGQIVRNQLLDGDAIFIRDLLDMKDKPDEELKHLAVLADAVMESYDLALKALDILEARGSLNAGAFDRYLGFYGLELVH